MVASRTAALTHPMTSISEEIFRLSILNSDPAAECPAAKLDLGSAQKVNNDRDEKNRSKESAANNHVDLRCL